MPFLMVQMILLSIRADGKLLSIRRLAHERDCCGYYEEKRASASLLLCKL